MINEQEVAQFLVERIKQSPGMLGAPLGALASAQFPGLNFRLNYNGLLGFVTRFCGDKIEIVRGQAGKDVLYRWKRAEATPDANLDSPDTSSIATRERETAWKVFTVPDSQYRIYIDSESSRVEVVHASENPLVSPFVEIPKMTTEEHRQIATEFLPQIESGDRAQFQEVLQAEDFWQRWFAATRTSVGAKYLKPWLTFRFERICDLFRQKLAVLNLPESVADVCLERLKQSKSLDRAVSATQRVAPAILNSSRSPLHSIAVAAIGAMSEEELRGLWLPLGVVADALRGHQTQ